MVHPLKQMVINQKKGIKEGIYSACTANELVIEACMERAMKDDQVVLVEATANQVNQNGGYTGMTPEMFVSFINDIATKVGFPKDKVILGGDHLGPLTWTDLNEDEAMENAKILIEQFVLAGFTKIHIDTSMKVNDDDKDAKLDTKVIAKRGAILAKVANDAYLKRKEQYPDTMEIVYVVGSEVPIPGGAQEEEEGIEVTKVEDFKETYQVFKDAFLEFDLQDVWNNVIAVVVQPGVEFGDETVHEYDREAAKDLIASLNDFDDIVFEGHSTDYQTKYCLKEMVEDGIAILKVGPGYTFALREGLFALALIEKELMYGKEGCSNLIEVLEEQMLKNPKNWKKHYHGDDLKLRLARKYSYSDRCRYYLPDPKVDKAIDTMFENLKEIPLTLVSQYLPIQYDKIREGILANDAKAIAKDRVINTIDQYLFATNQ